MGIPDTLTLDPQFAKQYDLPCIEYQAKLFRCFGRFSIDREGRLIEHQHCYEHDENTEQPLMCRRIEVGDRFLAFHGDLRLYSLLDGDDPIDFVARFTDGIATSVIAWTDYPEELKELASAE